MQSPIAVRLGGLALTLALAGGLAACDDDPVPQIPDATGTPSVSASPDEPVEPTLPAAAEGDGVEAAKAFVEHYYDYINYAQRTGETAGLKSLGVPTCEACVRGVEFIETIYERGGLTTGGEYTVLSADVTGRRRVTQTASRFYLTVVTQHTEQQITGAGDLNRTYKAGTGTLRYEVGHDPKGWRVLTWGAAP